MGSEIKVAMEIENEHLAKIPHLGVLCVRSKSGGMPTGNRRNTKNIEPDGIRQKRQSTSKAKETKARAEEIYRAQISSAIVLRATQSEREMCFLEGSYSQGERISTLPAATASKRASEGL